MRIIAFVLGAVLLAGLAAGAGAADPQPGEKFRDCPECPELVAVPAGRFVMGSDSGEPNESPAHPVVIARPFAIGIYEVTFAEWEACVAAAGCSVNPDDHKWGRERRPIINVNFAQVQEYLRWISARTGKTYRLPSEAEWEYAARAGTTTPYWWGDAAGTNLANCRDCGSEWSKLSSGPVGSFKPNPWGLHDTSGNVWEWTADCWNKTHAGATADGSARTTGDCRNRVVRGGSWYYFSKNARSSWRWWNDARVNGYGFGFRVLRELP